jgi:hypothetical protein
MKAYKSFSYAAFTLISSIAASPFFPARALQRRWDASPLPPCTFFTPCTYVGCFYEAYPMTLQYNPNLNFSTMTVEICTVTCEVSIDRLHLMIGQIVNGNNH